MMDKIRLDYAMVFLFFRILTIIYGDCKDGIDICLTIQLLVSN